MAAERSAESGQHVPAPKRRSRLRERGQAIIEFALVAPILLTLLLGLVEIGNGINSYIKIIAVSRDAARYGGQTCSYAEIASGSVCKTNIRNLITTEGAPLRGNESWVSTDICSSNTSAGTCIQQATVAATNAVKVKVCYDHPLLVGLPGVIPNPLRMCSTSTMRVLQP